jgi:hypothetical protein
LFLRLCTVNINHKCLKTGKYLDLRGKLSGEWAKLYHDLYSSSTTDMRKQGTCTVFGCRSLLEIDHFENLEGERRIIQTRILGNSL